MGPHTCHRHTHAHTIPIASGGEATSLSSSTVNTAFLRPVHAHVSCSSVSPPHTCVCIPHQHVINLVAGTHQSCRDRVTSSRYSSSHLTPVTPCCIITHMHMHAARPAYHLAPTHVYRVITTLCMASTRINHHRITSHRAAPHLCAWDTIPLPSSHTACSHRGLSSPPLCTVQA